MIQISVKNVVLDNESRAKCRNVKYWSFGNVKDAIECGDWYIPVENYKYTHIKSELEKGFREFYGLDFNVTVKSFDTGILEIDKN